MKSIAIILTIFCFSLSATDWKDTWSLALEASNQFDYTESNRLLDLAISEMESTGERFYPAIYIDRARVQMFKENYKFATRDISRALSSKSITDEEFKKAKTILEVCSIHLGLKQGTIEETDTGITLKMDDTAYGELQILTTDEPMPCECP